MTVADTMAADTSLPRYKSAPGDGATTPPPGTGIFDGGFLSPVMVCKQAAVEHNVAALARFLAMRLSVIVKATGDTTSTPPENAVASPTVFVARTELRVKTERSISAVWTSPLKWIPPPLATCSTSLGSSDAREAEFLDTTLSRIVNLGPARYIAPPSEKRAPGPVAEAWLLVIRLPITVTGPS